MGQALWLQFSTGHDQSMLLVEEDFVAVQDAFEGLVAACNGLGVPDITAFIDFTELLQAVAEELPEDQEVPSFAPRPTPELIRTLAALTGTGTGTGTLSAPVRSELERMLELCRAHQGNFDRVRLLALL